MKNKLIPLAVIAIAVGVVLYLRAATPQSMANPAPQQSINPTPSPAPSATPVEFHFDSSTNLQKELDQVVPQTEKTDYEPIKKAASVL